MAWFNWKDGRLAAQQGDSTTELTAREPLLLRLDHERARSDRSGKPFALVVFDLGQVPGNGRAHQRLADTLTRRLRRTDACGVLDVERVAALLPETALDPAWTVANDVREATLDSLPGLACAVYAYPSAWWGEDDSRGDAAGTDAGLGGGNGYDAGRPRDHPARRADRAATGTARTAV
jgi:GGDEF domain-containing protein